MRRILEIVLHNWPLKLAAVGLATVLYGGLVLSQGARTFDGQVPIRPPVIPPGMWLLEQPPPVTSIRYFAPTKPRSKRRTPAGSRRSGTCRFR